MREEVLYISDLDGTLLNSDSVVSEVSASLLNDAIDAGALFTVATARTAATVEPLLACVHTDVPLIVMTGAAFWDRERGEYVAPVFIPRDIAAGIMASFRESGLNPFVYCMDKGNRTLQVYHSRNMSRSDEAFYMERKKLHLKSFHIGSEPPGDVLGRIPLVFATGPTERVSELAGRIRRDFHCAVSAYPDIFHKEISLIEVFAEGVSKADAILRLKGELGIDRVVVFGDNLNDLPMFDVADYAVAVGNAHEEVCRRADEIIGRNFENSVARYIYNKVL